MINNAQEFITRWSQVVTPIPEDLEKSQKSISEEVSKATNGGAWFAWCMGNAFIWFSTPYGVQLGNIVKGLETNAPVKVLNFPFSWHDFWYSVIRIDKK